MFGNTIMTRAQWEAVALFIDGTPEGNVVGFEFENPMLTNALMVTPLLDNGEEAAERYTRGDSRIYLVCGKDVTEQFLGAKNETTEVQA